MTEIDLIEKAAVRAGMISLLNNGAASCVHSEGCNGVTQEHLVAFAREVALHCATALAAAPAAPADPGPWKVDLWPSGPLVLQSDDFEHDVALVITGDFADAADKRAYADRLCAQFNGLAAAPVAEDPYELDDTERALLETCRKAVAYDDNGDPAKDAIDEDEMIDAMRLLLRIVDAKNPAPQARDQHHELHRPRSARRSRLDRQGRARDVL